MITVNHMGHFYLTYLLLDLLKKSKEGRVINISSSGYVVAPENYMEDWEFERKNFSMLRQYLSTKLLNILFTVGLANYFEKNNLNNLKSAALNPGGVNTKSENSTCFIKICMTLCCCLFKKPDDGVKTHLHLCNVPFNELQNGKYYDEDQKVKKVEERATNHENV